METDKNEEEEKKKKKGKASWMILFVKVIFLYSRRKIPSAVVSVSLSSKMWLHQRKRENHVASGQSEAGDHGSQRNHPGGK